MEKLPLFVFDNLTIMMIALVITISLVVQLYSVRYLRTESNQKRFFGLINALTVGIVIFLCADAFWLLWAMLALNNTLLCFLLMHSQGWQAAKQAARHVRHYLALELFILASALLVLYIAGGTTHLSQFDSQALILHPSFTWVGFALLLLAVMLKSAVWPFYRWLLCTLNAPTPLSAFLHAGFISAGLYLLVRLQPLFESVPYGFHIIFLIGVFASIQAILWKFVQSDIKRTLVFSTSGQMSFVFVEIGLGLFGAAMTHIICHALYKAFMFLNAGTGLQVEKNEPDFRMRKRFIPLAILLGFIGAYGFILGSGRYLLAADGQLFLGFIIFLSLVQLSLSMLYDLTLKRLFFSFLACFFSGLIYGATVFASEILLEPVLPTAPVSLSAMHYAVMLLIGIMWFVLNFARPWVKKQSWYPRLYCALVNGGQPPMNTITALRYDYRV